MPTVHVSIKHTWTYRYQATPAAAAAARIRFYGLCGANDTVCIFPSISLMQILILIKITWCTGDYLSLSLGRWQHRYVGGMGGTPDRPSLKRMYNGTVCGHLAFARGWASECPNVKTYNWRLNPVWHKMLYSCTHMATV